MVQGSPSSQLGPEMGAGTQPPISQRSSVQGSWSLQPSVVPGRRHGSGGGGSDGDAQPSDTQPLASWPGLSGAQTARVQPAAGTQPSGTARCPHPDSLHTSTVHAKPSSAQVRGLPAQVPFVHWSRSVQTFPSSQTDPESGVCTQPANSQRSAVQPFPSSQPTAVPGRQRASARA